MNPQLKKALEKCAEYGRLDTEKVLSEAEATIAAQKELREKDFNITGANAGAGAELRTEVIYQDELYSMVANRSKILPKLPGNHGQIQSADTVKVPVVGEAGYFARGAELGTADVFGDMQADNTLATAQATITFQKFSAKFVVSRETLKRYIGGEGGVLTMIQGKIVDAFDNSVNSFLVNGDSDDTATNINGITDLAVWGKDHRIGSDGIRKTGASNTIVGGSAVAYSRAILKGLMDTVENYCDDPAKMLWVMGANFANKVRFDPIYSSQDVFGSNASNTQGGWVLRPEGIEALITKDYPKKMTAAGVASATGTYTGASLIYTPAVQYAFGEDMTIIVHERADGLLFDCVGYFGFDIVNGGPIDNTVATAVCLK